MLAIIARLLTVICTLIILLRQNCSYDLLNVFNVPLRNLRRSFHDRMFFVGISMISSSVHRHPGTVAGSVSSTPPKKNAAVTRMPSWSSIGNFKCRMQESAREGNSCVPALIGRLKSRSRAVPPFTNCQSNFRSVSGRAFRSRAGWK